MVKKSYHGDIIMPCVKWPIILKWNSSTLSALNHFSLIASWFEQNFSKFKLIIFLWLSQRKDVKNLKLGISISWNWNTFENFYFNFSNAFHYSYAWSKFHFLCWNPFKFRRKCDLSDLSIPCLTNKFGFSETTSSFSSLRYKLKRDIE